MKKAMVKLICLLTVLSLFKPCVLANSSSDYIWLEAEEQSSSMPYFEDSSASGGAMLKASYFNYTDDDYLNVDFEYEITSSDIYDIWALIQVPPGGHISNVYFSSDDADLAEYKSGDNNFAPLPVYQSTVWGVDFDLCWVKVTTKELSQDTHRLRYALDDIQEIGQPDIFNGMIDCIAVVPSEWEWTPSTDLEERPQNTVNKIGTSVWLEGENGIITAGKADIREEYTGEKISGGKFLYGRYQYSSAPVSVNYGFKVKETNQYDVWVLMNEQSSLWGAWEIDLNGEVTSSCDKQIELTALTTDNEHGKPIYWQRIYNGITLDEGLAELELNITENATGNGWAMFMLDCIAVVPSDMQWQPKADVSPIVSAMEIDMQTLMESYFSQTDTVITEDLSFPEANVKLPCSSEISINSDNDYISSDGAVTRPEFLAGDAQANVEISLSNDGYTKSNAISYTVKRNEKYLCESFCIVDETGTETDEVGNASFLKAKARIKLSGAENNGLTGGAVLALCLYDNGVLEDIDYQQLSLSHTYTDMEAVVEVPQNSTKCTVRAFLLSDWNVAAEIRGDIFLQ